MTTTMDAFVLFYKASNDSFSLFKQTTELSLWKEEKTPPHEQQRHSIRATTGA